MKFTSAIATLLTVAAVTHAQEPAPLNVIPIEANACSNCSFAALPKEPTCAALSAEDYSLVNNVFKDSAVHLEALGAAIKKDNVKKCLCSWILGVFSGSGSSCLLSDSAGAAPACSEAQKNEAIQRSAPFSSLVNCSSVGVAFPTIGTNGTQTPVNSPNTAAGTNPSGQGNKAGGAASTSHSSNAPLIVSVIAVAIAAAVGL
ncbi:hypothetical protein BGW38_000658 [Lunasporangiospora selenospora]|uniref:Uncharacterized protein n=1 Tax=Lunasporangiospora selenospora TaxID=979761 RepID=A0A9P6KI37_9FUNG|nr:hypothetical protein BGW38_000658 [Lunasporangiospora selenospora]